MTQNADYVHRWRYRVVYQGADGATELYFTDDRNDAWREAEIRDGQVQGPLGDAYWGPAPIDSSEETR